MISFLWMLAWFIGLMTLAYNQANRQTITITLLVGYIITFSFADISWLSHLILLTLFALILLPINFPIQRQQYLILPLLEWFKNHIPKISNTERDALEAGTVWWDQELFSGKPDWQKLFNLPVPRLTEEEQAFLDGPVHELCGMINEWKITEDYQDLPPEIWQFLKEKGFFALAIPKDYEGLAFSALAHSEILTKIAGCSLTVASTVAVPNSLGPAELLCRYGSEEQKNYYLPRLARGEEIPCFALTNPEAGSDAASIPDKGIVCREIFRGVETLGIRLNWDKRYITLAPIATLLGLAFKLADPQHLLGDKTNIGITVALIPMDLPGMTQGQRHRPLNTPFQNGPIQGKNVFIPVEWIIGGATMAGEGWRMLVECLSCGRAISLPASAAGGSKVLAATTGAYARIRRQFKQPIGYFEGVEEALARIAGTTYIAEAARQSTAACIDRGGSPAVLGAIIKYHLTEGYRQITLDAMDIHGGKGIMLGPRNYIAQHYQNSAIAITVEGANILTRTMIIFGQGVMRAHPYIMPEMKAAALISDEAALFEFDSVFMQHASYFLSNLARSFVLGLRQFFWSSDYIAALNRASASFAFIVDCCLLVLGGKLKFKEKLSGRLSDMLSMMYLASCALKRFQDQGKPAADKPLIEWVLRQTLANYWIQMESVCRNFPNRIIGVLLRAIVMPLGKRVHKPDDKLGHQVARILLSPNEARERLLQGLYQDSDDNKPLGLLEEAFIKIIAMEEAQIHVATQLQAELSKEMREEAENLRKEVIAVDSFEVLT